MNTAPSSAVEASQTRLRWTSPRVIEATARAMVSELISRTNELTDVNGMSNTSVGPRPGVLRRRSSREVAMSAPTSTQSSAGYNHNKTLAYKMAVPVSLGVLSCSAVLGVPGGVANDHQSP